MLSTKVYIPYVQCVPMYYVNRRVLAAVMLRISSMIELIV